MNSHHGYPRPQLHRRDWTALNGPWRFAYDDALNHSSPETIDDWPYTIEVPFAPESVASGIQDTAFHRSCWYERDFALARDGALGPLGTDLRTILHFGAVDYLAEVWINGRFAGRHEGGHTPFALDITKLLNPGETQRVSVRAIDDPFDLEKPRGKQDWRLEPHSIWYPRTTGIWQTVWIERINPLHIAHLHWTPNLERWEIALHITTSIASTEAVQLRVTLRIGSNVLVHDEYEVLHQEVHRRITLSDPGIDDFRNELLWSPERPTLIEARLELRRNGSLVDEVDSYTALRSVSIQREKVLLNARSYPLRLVLDQGYWPDTLMTPPSDEAIRADVQLIKDMGFNGARKHQKIEDPRYLYWADVLGLLVWEEMPSAYRFSALAINRMLREWTEVIERDRSHPCIIVWVPFNESWGVPDLNMVAPARDAVAALYHLTRTLDPTRLVIGNDGWESSATDIIGIHDYDADPSHFRVKYGPEVKPQELIDRRWTAGRILTLDGFPHKGQPICLSEFGGIAQRPAAGASPGEWGYTTAGDPEEFEKLTLNLIAVVRTTAMFTGFCYTQFADTFQEANGLVTASRQPKLPLEKIAAAVRGPWPAPAVL